MEPIYEELTDQDLQKNKYKYDIDTLVWNIKHSPIELRVLVRTQKLTPYVCAKYVVFGGKNEKYACGSEDAWLATGDILRFQPHITKDEMSEAHMMADNEDEMEDHDFNVNNIPDK